MICYNLLTELSSIKIDGLFISVTKKSVMVLVSLSVIRAVCPLMLTDHVAVALISWWRHTSDSYSTMAKSYVSKGNGGHSHLSRLLWLLFLAGNARIFHLFCMCRLLKFSHFNLRYLLNTDLIWLYLVLSYKSLKQHLQIMEQLHY